MGNLSFLRLHAAAAAASLLAVGCTTDLRSATDAHAKGDFVGAAQKFDEICPTIVTDGMVTGLKVKERRDRLWAGLEKGRALGDAGDSSGSVGVLRYVWNEADDLREIESWYLENPFDVQSWDAGQFLEDAGQLVVGADQTTYLLQPYEMILVRTYLCLESLLAGLPGAESEAKGAMDLQQYEAEDLARAGYEVAQPPIAAMDKAVRGKVPAGKTTDFSVGSILSFGEFGNARKAMKEAISVAQSMRAADPRVAYSTVVQWASHMKARNMAPASAAAAQLTVQSGATGLAREMTRLSGTKGYTEDWALVLVEAGRGPVRGSFDVRLPIYIPTIGVATFRGVYPYLKFRADDRPSALAVEAAGGSTPLEVLTSIDAVAARNFQRRERELWWTPTIRAAIRTITALVAQGVQDKDDGTTKLIIALVGAVVAEAEQPDLRIWSTLPATQHAAIVARPADGRIAIRVDSPIGSDRIEVDIPPGASIVHVRALNARQAVTRVGALSPR